MQLAAARVQNVCGVESQYLMLSKLLCRNQACACIMCCYRSDRHLQVSHGYIGMQTCRAMQITMASSEKVGSVFACGNHCQSPVSHAAASANTCMRRAAALSWVKFRNPRTSAVYKASKQFCSGKNATHKREINPFFVAIQIAALTHKVTVCSCL